MSGRRLFRKKALDRLSSPERLDRLIEVVRPQDWLALLACVCLAAAALAWGIVARVPAMATGRGVLIRPGKVVAIQAPASGKLIGLRVRGTLARPGDVLGTVGPPDGGEAPSVDGGRIVSVHGGRVLETAVNVGQMVMAGQRLGSIEEDDPSVLPVAVCYFPVRDGNRIDVGMPIQLTPDTVDRARFGTIPGSVTAVSPFPVTREGAASITGSVEIADSLLATGPAIEVTAALEQDASTFSGYRWSSSRGPRLRIPSGTTLTARVAVERRAPITYVLPFFRSLGAVH